MFLEQTDVFNAVKKKEQMKVNEETEVSDDGGRFGAFAAGGRS